MIPAVRPELQFHSVDKVNPVMVWNSHSLFYWILTQISPIFKYLTVQYYIHVIFLRVLCDSSSVLWFKWVIEKSNHYTIFTKTPFTRDRTNLEPVWSSFVSVFSLHENHGVGIILDPPTGRIRNPKKQILLLPRPVLNFSGTV